MNAPGCNAGLFSGCCALILFNVLILSTPVEANPVEGRCQPNVGSDAYTPIEPIQSVSGLPDSFPTIPDALFRYGLQLNPANGQFDAINVRNAQTQSALSSFTVPLTIGSSSMGILEWGQQLPPVSLEHPEQLANYFYTAEQLQTPSVQATISEWASTFTSSQAAELGFLKAVTSTPAFNALAALKKLKTPADREKYVRLFPDYKLALDQQSALYVLDTKIMGDVPPHSDLSGTERHAMGAVTLLQFRSTCIDGNCHNILVPNAIFLRTNNGTKILESTFSSSHSTGSAWRLAILAARCSALQWGVVTGHILPYHVTTGAFQMAFFNNISPDHQVYKMFEPFSKYNMQWLNIVLANLASLSAFPYENDAPYLQNFLPILGQWGALYQKMPFRNQRPSRMLVANGLRVEDFTHRSAWDLLPIAKTYLKIENAAVTFVARLIETSPYSKDCMVKNDVQLQAFFNSAETDGKLGRLTPSIGPIRSSESLKDILSTYLYSVLAHGTGRLPVFTTEGNIPEAISSFMRNDIVRNDDSVEYSMSDMLQHVPDTNVLLKSSSFFNFFMSTTPYEPLVGNQNLYTGDDEQSQHQNDAVAHLRREVAWIVTVSMFRDGTPVSRDSVRENVVQWPLSIES